MKYKIGAQPGSAIRERSAEVRPSKQFSGWKTLILRGASPS
jgi:hypothetical protein